MWRNFCVEKGNKVYILYGNCRADNGRNFGGEIIYIKLCRKIVSLIFHCLNFVTFMTCWKKYRQIAYFLKVILDSKNKLKPKLVICINDIFLVIVLWFLNCLGCQMSCDILNQSCTQFEVNGHALEVVNSSTRFLMNDFGVFIQKKS